MSATSFGLQRQTFRAREQNAKMKIAHKTYTQYVMLHKTGARLKRHVSAITESWHSCVAWRAGSAGRSGALAFGPAGGNVGFPGCGWNLMEPDLANSLYHPPLLLVVLTL